jgi:hypothetical protein
MEAAVRTRSYNIAVPLASPLKGNQLASASSLMRAAATHNLASSAARLEFECAFRLTAVPPLGASQVRTRPSPANLDSPSNSGITASRIADGTS